jgi:hypothetical protein
MDYGERQKKAWVPNRWVGSSTADPSIWYANGFLRQGRLHACHERQTQSPWPGMSANHRAEYSNNGFYRV